MDWAARAPTVDRAKRLAVATPQRHRDIVVPSEVRELLAASSRAADHRQRRWTRRAAAQRRSSTRRLTMAKAPDEKSPNSTECPVRYAEIPAQTGPVPKTAGRRPPHNPNSAESTTCPKSLTGSQQISPSRQPRHQPSSSGPSARAEGTTRADHSHHPPHHHQSQQRRRRPQPAVPTKRGLPPNVERRTRPWTPGPRVDHSVRLKHDPPNAIETHPCRLPPPGAIRTN
jgi:hypothetical protein